MHFLEVCQVKAKTGSVITSFTPPPPLLLLQYLLFLIIYPLPPFFNDLPLASFGLIGLFDVKSNLYQMVRASEPLKHKWCSIILCLRELASGRYSWPWFALHCRLIYFKVSNRVIRWSSLYSFKDLWLPFIVAFLSLVFSHLNKMLISVCVMPVRLHQLQHFCAPPGIPLPLVASPCKL